MGLIYLLQDINLFFMVHRNYCIITTPNSYLVQDCVRWILALNVESQTYTCAFIAWGNS